jgi:hypothetical protein
MTQSMLLSCTRSIAVVEGISAWTSLSSYPTRSSRGTEAPVWVELPNHPEVGRMTAYVQVFGRRR